MRRFMRRIPFAALLLLILVALPAWAAVGPPPTAMLIPLDDRPSTLLFPQQIARIGGGLLRVPPRHLLGRAYTPGRSDAISEWMTQNRRSVERAIVSTDMLCYGGLVASRTSAASAPDALRRLSVLDGLGVPVVAFATIPRLSLRTSDAQAPYERPLHDWAASGKTEPPASVPPEIVQEYLGVRQRNLQVLHGLLERVDSGVVETLVIGQDDAAPRGPHLAERQALEEEIARRGLGGRVRILSGADELAMNLVAGWLARRAGVRPSFAIRYSDPEAGARIPPLESRPLDEAMDEHLALSGASRGPQADVTLFVEVPSEKPFEPPPLEARPEDLTRTGQLVAALQEARARGERVALADLRLVNRADPVLAREILAQVPLWDLEAYAAWNTPSNALGTAIAQAVVHTLARKRGLHWPPGRVLESEKTQQAFTFARLIDDFAYQALIRPTLSEDVKGLPRDPDPLLNLYGPAGLRARLDAVAWAREEFQKRLEGRSYAVPALRRLLEFQEMRLEVVLPWPRIFEVEARLDLRLVERPWPPAKPGTSSGSPSP